MVSVTHVGMHALQSTSHMQVHHHNHFDKPISDSNHIHTHGDEENNNNSETLVQVVFQCLAPLSLTLDVAVFKQPHKTFGYSENTCEQFLKKHTPPPEYLLS